MRIFLYYMSQNVFLYVISKFYKGRIDQELYLIAIYLSKSYELKKYLSRIILQFWVPLSKIKMFL